jgi:hypothetical protein
MHDDVLKKLEQRIDRRSFLRGSGLAAAVFVGASAFPLAAQEPAPSSPQKKDEKEEKKEDKKDEPKDTKSEAKDDKSKKEESKDAKAEAPDPFKETKKDEQGRDYRMCPQCGYNMYKQERTWTCENCGYSYAE